MKRRGIPFLFLVFLASCASAPEAKIGTEYTRTFPVKYDLLWRATQQALLSYPMNINNMDTGQLQTLYITGKHRYKAPHKEDVVLPSGYQYQININIIKGENASKVIVVKNARLQKDFFSNPEELPSDGFEEKMILYRIKRNVIVEKILERQVKRQEKQTPPPSTNQGYQ